jgi:hypothetical protein
MNRGDLALSERGREPLPSVSVGQSMRDKRGEAGLIRQMLKRTLAQAGLDGGTDGGLRLADGDLHKVSRETDG